VKNTSGHRWSIYILIALVSAAVGAGIGVFGYIYTVGGSGEASQSIADVAPTLALADVQATGDAAAELDNLRTQVAQLSTAVADAAAGAAQVAATPEVTPPPAESALAIFRIAPEQSQVSFTLEEDLNRQRTVVVGTTREVAGDIAVDFTRPASSQMGPITINMRTLATDNDFRNRAIRGEILQTARPEFEFSTFTPTAISGLPETVAVGDTFTIQVTGDFPIAGVTRPITFATEITVESEDVIRGVGTTTVLRSDYDLNIPNVPSVANVTDEVELRIEFVAQRVE
jgi:polyisoprenoid-binding protein YceI